MNAARDYRAIWGVTVMQRQSGIGRAIHTVGVLATIAVLALAVWHGVHDKQNVAGLLARGLAGLAGSWLAMTWGLVFLPASTLLNSAANARMVPRQRRRLIQISAVCWILSVAGIACAAGKWGAVPIAGLYLVVAAVAFGGSRYAWFLIPFIGNAPWLLGLALPRALFAAVTSPAGLIALTLLLAAVGGGVLGWLYPAGGDSHLRRYGRQVEFLKCFATTDWTGQMQASNVNLFGIRWCYAWALRSDCRKAEPGALLLHALGPTAHWSSWVASNAILLPLVALLWIMFGRTGAWQHVVAVASTMGLAGMALSLAFMAAPFDQMMRRTSGEQALLRLTPLAGEPALLNRRLGARLQRMALLNWLAVTAMLAALAYALTGDPGAVLRTVALCMLAGQAATLALLGNYARGPVWNWRLGLGAALLAALQAALAVGLGSATGTPPWPWMIVIAAIAAIVQLRHGWRRMLAAPPAYPAGRLA